MVGQHVLEYSRWKITYVLGGPSGCVKYGVKEGRWDCLALPFFPLALRAFMPLYLRYHCDFFVVYSGSHECICKLWGTETSC